MKKNLVILNDSVIYESNVDKFKNFILDHPLSICLKVTDKCNYSCKHCIADSAMCREEGLDTEGMLNVIKEIIKSGIKRVDITGGEPFIRKDINQLIEVLGKSDLGVVVTTNGSVMSEENIAILKKYNVFVQISIDGPEHINDELRQKLSFAKATSTARRLVSNGIPVRISCVVQKKNYAYIDDMYKLGLELGVASMYFIAVSAQGRAKDLKKKICLSSLQESQLRTKVSLLQKEKKMEIKLLDFKLFESGCILITNKGDMLSQRFDQDGTMNMGNVLDKKINDMWRAEGAYDHAIHLMQYLQHPALIK